MSKVEIDSLKEITKTKSPQELAQDRVPDINDPIGLYFNDLKEYPRLTPEEEENLDSIIKAEIEADRTLEGNLGSDEIEPTDLLPVIEQGEDARQILVERNLRLVVDIAKNFTGRGVSFLDLIQEGNLGIIKAADLYDPNKGRFSTYAYWWIVRYVEKAVTSKKEVGLRISHHEARFFGSVVLEQVNRNGWNISQLTNEQLEEIADKAKQPTRRISTLVRAARSVLSLSEEVGDDGDETLGDFIRAENEPIPDQIEAGILREKIEEVLVCLTAREELIIRERFGLSSKRTDGSRYENDLLTFECIARRFGLTRERVRQIETFALRRLRHPRNSRHLKDFYE